MLANTLNAYVEQHARAKITLQTSLSCETICTTYYFVETQQLANSFSVRQWYA